MARYVAERSEIAAHFAEWEITGQAEIRDVASHASTATQAHFPIIPQR